MEDSPIKIDDLDIDPDELDRLNGDAVYFEQVRPRLEALASQRQSPKRGKKSDYERNCDLLYSDAQLRGIDPNSFDDITFKRHILSVIMGFGIYASRREKTDHEVARAYRKVYYDSPSAQREIAKKQEKK